MQQRPYFSVITPLYNCREFIGETIQSVIDQTYEDWEMIVIDDCSSDGSTDVVKEFAARDSRIFLIELENAYGGPAGPRNIGIARAKGSYIALLDSDDLWHPDKLKTQKTILTENQNNAMVHTKSNLIDENSKDIGVFVSDRIGQKIINNILIGLLGPVRRELMGSTINTNTFVYSREIALQIPFDESPEIASIEDWKQRIEIFMRFPNLKVIKIDKALISYRIRANSISIHGSDRQRRKAIYMYSKFYLDKKISLMELCFGLFISIVGIIRISLRNWIYKRS